MLMLKNFSVKKCGPFWDITNCLPIISMEGLSWVKNALYCFMALYVSDF